MSRTSAPSKSFLPLLFLAILAICFPVSTIAQVDYDEENEYPWSETTDHGPDENVPGWFYNLGITGMRAQLDPARPRTLIVKYVFEGTPADGRVEVDDRILGVEGSLFVEAHQTGYGMDVFGARGPIGEFASALETIQGPGDNGQLALTIERGESRREVQLPVGNDYGSFGPSYPENCPKSARLEQELLHYLLSRQNAEGHWDNPVTDSYATLALLAQGNGEALAAAERCVRHYSTLVPEPDALFNWYAAAAGMMLAEFYQATGADWVPAELEKVRVYLLGSQYTDWPAQVHPEVRFSHPESLPEDGDQQTGGWGHNPGFEGYGPHGQLTAQGALVFAMMRRCGLTIDRERHDSAYSFLARGTGMNGYLWYADGVPDHTEWADMGRTGMAGIANWLSTYPDPNYRVRAIAHARVIGEHPESFPDTHASPPLGMATAAMGTFYMPDAFRSMMDANRWWFALAQCHDDGIYYQPNRDNAGYGGDSRLITTAVTAFIFALPRRNLLVSGKLSHDYDTWADSFAGMDLIDPTRDPDADGRDNFEEWIWGLNPGRPEDGSERAIFTIDRNLGFSYQRRRQGLSGKRFEIELSEDLSSWECDLGANQTAQRLDGDRESVRVDLSSGFRDRDRLFARVRVR